MRRAELYSLCCFAFETAFLFIGKAGSMQKYTKLPDKVEALVLQSLNSIKYGTITLTIQDQKVIQVESSEKIRVADKK